MLDEGLVREDLTALDFVTIDSASTEDMDDALFAKALPDGKLQLIVAIADPTAWIAEGSKLDKAAKIRAFTNHLPASTSLCCLASFLTISAHCAPMKSARYWHAA